MTIVKLKDHASNLDPTAVSVSSQTWNGGIYSVYRTNRGYVATLPDEYGIEELFATAEDARQAIEQVKGAQMTDAKPIETCSACLQEYWACACGAAPLGYDPNLAPTTCKNIYCHQHAFRWVTYRHCCQSYNHHVGSICRHCGQKD